MGLEAVWASQFGVLEQPAEQFLCYQWPSEPAGHHPHQHKLVVMLCHACAYVECLIQLSERENST